MTASPLISVVVASYNNWPDLELTIQSALCQSYRPIEVIVVDNSSTDATPDEVPKRFGDQIRYIRQPNTGDAGAYNAGARLVTGDFIQFLDGNDVLAPNKIAKQMDLFHAQPEVDIVYGDVRNFQSFPSRAPVSDQTTREHEDMLAAVLSLEPQGVEFVLSSLIRRRAFERVGPWDETIYCTDLDFWLRASWLGCRFARCPGLMGFSRVHSEQMSANRSAIQRGTEAVLLKARTYIDREPYRTMLDATLAQYRYLMAISGEGMTTRSALAKLRQARDASRVAVTLRAYWVAMGAIFVPGGRFAVRSPSFRSIRRFVARLVSFRIPRS